MQEPNRKSIFQENEIQAAVKGIAGSVAAWADSIALRELVLVSVLEGARPLTRDLVRELSLLRPDLVLKVHEIRARATDGKRLLEDRVWEGLGTEWVAGRDLVLVDDLVDSGKTLAALKGALLSAGARAVKTAVLVRKYGEGSGPVDFCGFDLKLDRGEMARQGLKDYWLYGYGMDEDGKSRDLGHIGWVEVR